jgi:hypothetical protein
MTELNVLRELEKAVREWEMMHIDGTRCAAFACATIIRYALRALDAARAASSER